MEQQTKQINALTVYERSGEIAGSSRRYGDEARARNETDWVRRALNLENEPYKSAARKAWSQAYKDGHKYGR